jgi:hypothetical protein
MAYSYRQGLAWSAPASAPAQTTGLLPAGPSCQPCPDCGGLECLCRPRFFAGQLLTEQDLNRLENYILAKNRLHNRYLVGHGVVCGLEVTCSPCVSTISVSDGYAIDPCGNDIIVCSPDTVDICKLIKACTPGAAVNCAPYKDQTYCADTTQTWILAIRYVETPSRGVTPLTGSSQCSCGASSSGSCTCGMASTKQCGCGGVLSMASCCGQTVTSVAPVSTNLPRRGAPPACEPTVTCEAYRYEVFPAPIDEKIPLTNGEFLARLKCCIQSVFPNGINVPTNLQDQVQWSNFCCYIRQALIQYLITSGGTDCQAIANLQAVVCPAPDTESFWTALEAALEVELIVMFEVLLGCFCSVALPPCPPPGDPRVPLAAVTVRTSDCTIISICDWTPLRKHVVTTKTLGYWFGWLPFVPMLREFMLLVCCHAFNLRGQLGAFTRQAQAGAVGPNVFAEQARTAPASSSVNEGRTVLNQPISFATQTYQPSNPISQAVAAILAGGTQSVTLGDLMHAMLDPADSSATAQNLQSTPRAKVAAEMIRPLISAFGPLLSAATGGLGQAGTSNATHLAQMTAMRTELDSLRATVTAQQSALDAMRSASPRTPG